MVLKDHWEEALDVLADLVANMQLTQKDFRLEKGVILQEIAMCEESQEEMVYDVFFDKVYGKHPLGRPILGSPTSIASMTQKQVMDYYRKNYSGKNIIVSAAGCVDHQELIDGIEKRLAGKKAAKLTVKREAPRWKPCACGGEQTGRTSAYVDGFSYRQFQRQTSL